MWSHLDVTKTNPEKIDDGNSEQRLPDFKIIQQLLTGVFHALDIATVFLVFP